MRSMTGYADASGRVKNLNIKVQIRSVNHRFFNLQTNLPEVLSDYEDEIKRLIQKYISRGAVNLSLKIDAVSSQPAFDFNMTLLKKYAQKLKTVQRSLSPKRDLDLSILIGLPGVIEPINPARQFTKQDLAGIKEIIKRSLVNFVRMREREGKRLGEKLKQVIHRMQTLIQKIRMRYPVMMDNYQVSLTNRIKDLAAKQEFALSDNLQQKIAEEVALVTQRSDITEELHRLGSHLKEFSQSMERDRVVGKKLDFLTQECLREINTIGSKANDAQIAHWVVNLKSEVEKLKEQVQNIE